MSGGFHPTLDIKNIPQFYLYRPFKWEEGESGERLLRKVLIDHRNSEGDSTKAGIFCDEVSTPFLRRCNFCNGHLPHSSPSPLTFSLLLLLYLHISSSINLFCSCAHSLSTVPSAIFFPRRYHLKSGRENNITSAVLYTTLPSGRVILSNGLRTTSIFMAAQGRTKSDSKSPRNWLRITKWRLS